MSSNSGDPVSTISEADATGATAALYADLRSTLGVPVVNLIWRHMATFPGGLEWAWEALKPLYANGTIDAEADALRDTLSLPVLPVIPKDVLYSVGLGDDDIARIMMILQSYERSNAMNMVALSALLARLEGTATSEALPSSTLNAVPAIDGAMPTLLALDAMPPHVRDLVVALNTVGGRTEIMASMYRHLANWPAYLGVIHLLLAPVAAEDKAEPAILGVVAEGRRRGDAIASGLARPEQTPDDDVQASLRKALATFVKGPIGKMITIVPLIRRAMPI